MRKSGAGRVRASEGAAALCRPLAGPGLRRVDTAARGAPPANSGPLRHLALPELETAMLDSLSATLDPYSMCGACCWPMREAPRTARLARVFSAW